MTPVARLSVLLALASALVTAPRVASGQAPGAETGVEPGIEPRVATDDDTASEPSSTADDDAHVQELGASLGLELGGRTTPGGLHLAGTYLYRLSDVDWFQGGLGVVIGSQAAGCFRDRSNQFLCDHGVARGASLEASFGMRHYFDGQAGFTPFVQASLGLRFIRFAGDDLGGVAVPLSLGGGVRAKVTDGIFVGGGADLRGGAGWFGRDLGAEPQASLRLIATVEFAL